MLNFVQLCSNIELCTYCEFEVEKGLDAEGQNKRFDCTTRFFENSGVKSFAPHNGRFLRISGIKKPVDLLF